MVKLRTKIVKFLVPKKIVLLLLFIFVIIFGSGCIISFKKTSDARDGGIFKSFDQGENWLQKVLVLAVGGEQKNIASVNTLSLVFDPQDYNTIYLGSDSNGLFFSYDGGESWHESRGLSGGRIEAIAVDPQAKCIIYVSSGNRIFKSTDCSRFWEEIYIDNRSDQIIQFLAIDYLDSSLIYAGTSYGELIESNDGGESWMVLKRFDNKVLKILIDPQDTKIIYLATEGRGIYKTIDKGESWIDLNQGLAEYPGSLNYRNLIFDPSQANNLILASNYGILRSFDGGENWQALKLLTPVNSTIIYSIVVNPQNSQEIYYATASTFYKTLDGGANWIPKRLPSSRAATTLLIDPINPNIIYMGLTRFGK